MTTEATVDTKATFETLSQQIGRWLVTTDLTEGSDEHTAQYQQFLTEAGWTDAEYEQAVDIEYERITATMNPVERLLLQLLASDQALSRAIIAPDA